MSAAAPETWKLKSQIRSGVLLADEDTDLVLKDNPPNHLIIRFSKPERVERPIYPAQAQCVNQPHWIYDVVIEFTANNEDDARLAGWNKLDSLVERLSFLGSVAVLIEKRGTMTNCPDDPVSGTTYVMLIHPDDMATISDYLPTIPAEQIQPLAHVLMSEFKGKHRDHLDRAFHWLHRSHFATTIEDQFAGMMLSFEALSSIFRTDQIRFWKCRHCGNELRKCPACHETTGSDGGGNVIMESFVCNTLAWPRDKWQRIWKIRNRILHGGRVPYREVADDLEEVEKAVICAFRIILRIPDGIPPQIIRERSPFASARLRVEVRVP
jgi:rubrerythrin